MRKLPWIIAERHRKNLGHVPITHYGDDYGFFMMHGPCGMGLAVMVNGECEGWEHVSVSCKNRCPNWIEMSFIKDMFWSEDECVMQLHPPKEDHINFAEYCLHLWRPTEIEIPVPPKKMVGAPDAK